MVVSNMIFPASFNMTFKICYSLADVTSTYVSETYALSLHIPNPHCHGYCCQNTLNSKGKPENRLKNLCLYDHRDPCFF